MNNKFEFDERLFGCFCDSSGSPVLLTDDHGYIQYINADRLSKIEKDSPPDRTVDWQPYNNTKKIQSTTACDDQLFLELKEALENNKLQLAAQPIFDLHCGEIKIIEILLRWTHSDYGEISPLKIIELAGKNKYLFEIATYVTENLIEFLHKNNDRHQNICFAINLNLPQITDSSLIEHLLELIDNSGISRSKLIFESTETDSLPISIGEASMHFSRIRSQGIKIAMDDFGAGYSTLDYINNFDVDFVKIDRSLVTGIESNSRKLDTLLSMIQLCTRIGVIIVIEGVENEHQHNLIIGSGIPGILVQGYLYQRPCLLSLTQFNNCSLMSQESPVNLKLAINGVG